MTPRSPEHISRAVGQPSVDIPLGGRRTPDIQAPRRKGHLRRDLAVAGGAAAVVATVAFGASQFNNGRIPGASPESSFPGGIVEPSNSPIPTPFSTDNPTVILPPSPEISPSPTPSTPPEATPVPSIEEVPINKYATIDMRAYDKPPFYSVSINKTTVVAVEKETNGTLLFAISTYGNKITKEYCSIQDMTSDWITRHYGAGKSIPVSICNFQGVTLWFMINKDSRTYDNIAQQPFGQGVNTAIPYIKVGEKIPAIQIYFTDEPGSNVKGNLLTMNRQDWAKLQNSVGESFPRSDRRFLFYVSGIGVTKK